jgi:hypothetical protein
LDLDSKTESVLSYELLTLECHKRWGLKHGQELWQHLHKLLLRLGILLLLVLSHDSLQVAMEKVWLESVEDSYQVHSWYPVHLDEVRQVLEHMFVLLNLFQQCPHCELRQLRNVDVLQFIHVESLKTQ